jgi:cobalt-zinc-cadmium resistance protein CzcA
VYADAGTRFNSITAGIGIPLYFTPVSANIQAARIGVQIAESNLRNAVLSFNTELVAAYNNYKKFKNVVNYYEDKALPQAKLLYDFTEKSFEAGETGYIEFLQNVNQAALVNINYLQAIEQYNNAAITLDYLVIKQ